jgi:hypothetical protein
MRGHDRRRLVVLFGVVLTLAATTTGASARETRTEFPMPHFRVDPPTSDLSSVTVEFGAADAALGGTWRVALAVFAGPPSGALTGANLGTASMIVDDWQCTGAETPDEPSDDTFADVELIARPRFDVAPTGLVSPKLERATVSGTLTASYAPVGDPCPPDGNHPTGTLSIPIELRLTGTGPVDLTRSSAIWTLSRSATGTVSVDGASSPVAGTLRRQMTWAPAVP